MVRSFADSRVSIDRGVARAAALGQAHDTAAEHGKSRRQAPDRAVLVDAIERAASEIGKADAALEHVEHDDQGFGGDRHSGLPHARA